MTVSSQILDLKHIFIPVQSYGTAMFSGIILPSCAVVEFRFVVEVSCSFLITNSEQNHGKLGRYPDVGKIDF